MLNGYSGGVGPKIRASMQKGYALVFCAARGLLGVVLMLLASIAPLVGAESPTPSTASPSPVVVPIKQGLDTLDRLLRGPKVGEGRFDYYFWTIYDAALFAPSKQLDWQAPFALKLDYHRPLKGVAIAKRSVKEMRRQTFEGKGSREIKLAAWYTQMSEIFPDVEMGDSIIGVYFPGKGAQFWQGHRKLGDISDVDFSRRFFEIWLGSMTSAPELRAALLGVLE